MFFAPARAVAGPLGRFKPTLATHPTLQAAWLFPAYAGRVGHGRRAGATRPLSSCGGRRLATLAAGLLLSSCGGGTIANEDLPGPAIAAIIVVIVVALLYVAYIGGKNR